MYISGINYESVNDGEGVRLVIFVSGCLWDCEGCHNKDTHSFTYGKPYTKEILDLIIHHLKTRPFLSGITISGGDPLFSKEEVSQLIDDIKAEIPNVNIWVYTGFVFENLLQDKSMLGLLEKINVLVDGRFELEQRDVTLRYRGSYNQRIINVPQSLQENKVSLYYKD